MWEVMIYLMNLMVAGWGPQSSEGVQLPNRKVAEFYGL